MDSTINEELQETAIAFLKWARNTLENEPANFETMNLVPQVSEVACTIITHLRDQGAGESPEHYVQKLQQPQIKELICKTISESLNKL